MGTLGRPPLIGASERKREHYAKRQVGARIVAVHRLRAEAALGYPLPPKAVVHHADGTKSIDSPLVICQDEVYHQGLHRRMRVLRAGGRPFVDHVCCTCRRARPISDFPRNRNSRLGYVGICKECSNRRIAALRRGDSAYNRLRRERYANR